MADAIPFAIAYLLQFNTPEVITKNIQDQLFHREKVL